MADFSQLYTRINRSFDDTEKIGDVASYQRIAMIFSKSENQLREYIQEITKDKINKTIEVLETGKELSKEDIEFIKLWIIGDAEYYVKMENNFNDWLVELKRIIREINKINDSGPNFEAASRLRALLEDGKRVISDIAFFLKKKERIADFRKTALEIGKEERNLFVKLLRNKLASKEL